MNWMNLLLCALISIGGFIAAVYESMAISMGLPVGLYFRKNGIMTVVGGFVTFGGAILSAFINPWWTLFLILFAGWFFSQMLIRLFRNSAPMLSIFLVVIGIILLLVKQL